MSDVIFRRDEHGRPIAEDGWPISGNAKVSEAAVAGALSESKVYLMISRGELPTQRFGRSVRIPWSVVRERLLNPSAGMMQ